MNDGIELDIIKIYGGNVRRLANIKKIRFWKKMISFKKFKTVRTFSKSFCGCYLSIIVIVTLVGTSAGDRRQFDLSPDLPSHLPAPSEDAPPPDPNQDGGGSGQQGGNFGGSGPFGFFAGNPPIPPPQNVPVGAGPLGPGAALPEDFVPFGLNHIILIIVPQFKTKFRKLPHWLESSVKVAMPITVFFDKLELGPNFPPALLPPGAVPPGATPAAGASAAAATGALNSTQPFLPGYTGQYYYPGVYPYFNQEGDDDEDEDADDDTDIDDFDPYDNYYAEDKKTTRKKKRSLNELESTVRKNRQKRSVPFNKTVHSAERAALLPKLENILDTTGLGGKSCLLRTVCEVHEAPLHHYGLLGELFTMIFSVSRSAYAESHLPEYLRAERMGKSGDCAQFYKDCDKTMFSWQETMMHSDLENIISDDY